MGSDEPPRDEPLLRVQSLHALAYCERLFYLEEVEEIRLVDASMYAGRRLHVELEKGEEGDWAALDLESEKLGLRGRVDCLKRRDGALVPYEHKRGRCRREGPDETAGAWPTDRVQVAAYALLVEEALEIPVPEARVRYHEDGVTVRVPIDDAARADVAAAVRRARELRAQPTRPPVTENERLCVKCALAPACLPEEQRVADGAKREPLRLFPADAERTSLHVVEHGARIGRQGERLKIDLLDGPSQSLPVRQVSDIVIHGFAQISTQALRLCAAHDIPVHWVAQGGDVLGSFSPGGSRVQRRIRQYEALRDGERRLDLARTLVRARLEGQVRFLLRATREQKDRRERVASAIQGIRDVLRRVGSYADADSLRGGEGRATALYFGALPEIARSNGDSTLQFEGRNRRPPRDRANALLSFGYGMVYRTCLQAIHVVGLEPAFGFYHTPRSTAEPLALDVMEMFRLPLWDMPLVGSINRRQWDAEADFEATKEHVWLSQAGRRKAIELYERRLAEEWRHPVTRYSLSYSRLVELEVRLLEKQWSGEGALFARFRLR